MLGPEAQEYNPAEGETFFYLFTFKLIIFLLKITSY